MKYFLVLTLAFLSSNIFSQAPSIQWQKTYGGSLDDVGNCIFKTNDGGFIIAGSTESSDGDVALNKGFTDYWLIKLDSSGNLEWEKTYGGSRGEEAVSVSQTFDNGFIIFGRTDSYNGDVSGLHVDSIFPTYSSDAWLIKTDSLGQIQWQRCIGGTEEDWGKDLFLTTDNNYLIAEEVRSNDGDVSNLHGQIDYWLAKVNNNNSIAWGKTFGGLDYDIPRCCIQSSNGGYLIVGVSQYDFGGFHGISGSDIGIVKVDSTGILEWSKCYGGTGIDEPYSITTTTNGGFYIAGQTSSNDGDINLFYGSSDIWISKIDSNGSILWQKSLGGSFDDWPSKILETTDGGIIVSASTSSNDFFVTNNHGWYDWWIFKLDSLGKLEWEKSFGGTLEERSSSIVETSDGGFVICGFTLSSDGDITSNHGEKDVWVVKLSPPNVAIDEVFKPINYFNAFCNNGILNINFNSKISSDSEIELIDITGKLLLKKEVSAIQGNNSLKLSLDKMSSGLFIVRLKMNSFILNEKVFIPQE